MKLKLKMILATGAVALMALGGATSASAAPSGTANCSGGRTLGTTSTSGIGAVAHAQIAGGTTWTKSWNNTVFSSRYYNKGLTGSVSWGISSATLSGSSGTCDA